MPHRVFVYGSLLRGLHNHHWISKDSRLLGAALSRERYVIVDSGDGYPYALDAEWARPGIDTPAPLHGELYEVGDGTLDDLDALEGHPDYYRRRIAAFLIGADEAEAALYVLRDASRLDELRADSGGQRFAAVTPAGDWRTHLLRRLPPLTWPPTRRTLSGGPHAVFCYGGVGPAALREHCEAPHLSSSAAALRGAVRIYGGHSVAWGGAVASLAPRAGGCVWGSLASLTDDALRRLDAIEGADPADPYGGGGAARRQDVGSVWVDGERVDAVLYLRRDVAWRGPPSDRYIAACEAHVADVWDEELAAAVGLEVLDEAGELRTQD